MALHGAVVDAALALPGIDELSGAQLVEEGGDGLLAQLRRPVVLRGLVPVLVREEAQGLKALRQMQAGLEEVRARVEGDTVQAFEQQGQAVVVEAADAETRVVALDGVELPGHGARELDGVLGLVRPLVDAARRAAEVFAQQGRGVLQPCALGVDCAVVDDAGYHIHGKAVLRLRQL